MTADSEMEIKEAFNRAQKGHNNKAKLVAVLKNRYNTLEDKTLFHEKFIHYLKYAMIVYKREPAVENVIEFVAKFASSFQSSSKNDKEGEQQQEEEEEDEEEEDDHPFLTFIFNFLLEVHMLVVVVDPAQVTQSMTSNIFVCVSPVMPSIQLLTPHTHSNCSPPHAAYMLILDNDSNAEVRRAVLSCIAMSPITLVKVLKRTRDVKESVRKLAYQVLADKVHVKALSIAQRVTLLEEGLHDTSEAVREAVKTRLLPSWLKHLDGDVVLLLPRLDVENCSETALEVLKAIFTNMPEEEMLKDRTHCSVQGGALCEFVRAKGDEGEEMLEKILPDAATYADYLQGFVRTVPVLSEAQRAEFNSLEMAMRKEFISQQLIHLVGCLDTNEEGGRKRVLAVLQELLCRPQTPASLVSLLTEKLLSLIPDDNRRIQMVAEIISDVREPIAEAGPPLDEAQDRRRQIKLAEVKVRILEARQALDDCIAAQEFSNAAQFKDSITELENQRNLVLQEAAEGSQPVDREVRTEKSDPDTLLRCLTMCAELLKQMNIKTRIGPTLSAIVSSLIVPCIANAHPAVRNMAVVCLGTSALHSKELAKAHMVLLLQIAQLDEVKIRISALRSIIDLLLLFSFQLLSEKPVTQATPASHSPGGQEEEEPTEEKGDLAGDTAQSILQLLSEFLDGEVSDLRTETAQGLAKLMYMDRFSSAKMFSRLVLLWYNPVTEGDTSLRHCLGVFFQLYARESRAHQEVVGESFLPTVRTLMNAPATSPLAEVDPSNVVELLVELTRPGTLIKPSANHEVCVHDSMALRVCGEILKDQTAPEVRLYAKTLNNLEVSANEGTRQELHALLLEVVKDRISLRAVEKVIDRLVDSKEQAEQHTETALQPLDINADGQKKTPAPKSGRKGSRRAESSEESDGENVPESLPRARPSRRAKTAALERYKLDLNPLIDQEANTS
uniref:Non-SMC condensin I complex, subunit G n=1 Tax=Gadus morhua TaxID=8049 RepID=A0A8C5CQ78_GADMO